MRRNRSDAVTATVGEGGKVEMEGRGKGKTVEGFNATSRRRRRDRCWIMLGKWSMGSITCLVVSEEE